MTGAETRRMAEMKVAAMQERDPAEMSPEEVALLLYELRVHQAELEIQNEELHRAQVALDAARARYFDLYEMAPVGYLALSEKNLVLEANLRAAALLGMGRGELVKKPITLFVEPEDQDVFYLHRKRLFETGKAQICELRMKRPDGGKIWVRLDATTARDESIGESVCRVTLADITEKKRGEEERADLLAAELEARLKAEAALRIRDEFISAAAHDLRTPLGALIVQVEGMEKMIQRGMANPARTEQGLDLIERQARRMARLVNNLLNLSRYSDGQPELRRSPCDLAMITRDVCDRHTSELRKNGCYLELELAAGITGEWDRDGIEQVIENLLSNAIKFGPGKPVRIEVAAANGCGRLTIADRGAGIPADQLTRIFELYARAHAASHHGGLGMGLHIALKIVSAHEGRLVAANRPDGGAVFIMELPSK